MEKIWRVGILGLGHWYSGFGLARALPEYPKAELVAVAWHHEQHLEEFATTFGVDGYGDYDDLLKREDIDIVHIAPPVAEIPECTIKAAQAGKHMVLGKPPEDLSFRQITGNGMPVLATVITLHQVRLEVSRFMMIKYNVYCINIMEIRFDVIDEGFFRNPVKPLHSSPVLSSILGHLYQTIIRSDINESFLQRRFGDRGYIAVLRHGADIINRIDAPYPVHVFQFIAIPITGKVRADGHPGIAPVVAAVKFLGAVVKTCVGMRTNKNR